MEGLYDLLRAVHIDVSKMLGVRGVPYWGATLPSQPLTESSLREKKATSHLGSQVRSGLHANGEPVLGRRRKKHNMYTAAIYMRQKSTNEAKCEFHTTSSNSLHDPRFAYLQYA